jgi:hypothetical protein
MASHTELNLSQLHKRRETLPEQVSILGIVAGLLGSVASALEWWTVGSKLSSIS